MRWIVVVNSVSAKFYHAKANKNLHKITLVQELKHPEGSERNQDFTTDRPGHYQTGHMTRGSYNESNAKEIENERFAKVVAKVVEDARKANQLESLTLVADPHFAGLLDAQFSKPLKRLIHQVIQKNCAYVSEKEITEIISKN